MNYELSIENFEGPIDKLLELVQERKLEITLVSLAAVTADFLEHIKKLENQVKSRSFIADFLLVASKLILIKSKVLLPSLELEEDEKTDIEELERRLKIYQEFKAAKDYIRSAWGGERRMHSREFLMSAGPLFYPPRDLRAEKMLATLQNSVGELQKLFKPVTKIRAKIISLRQKIQETLKRLAATPMRFRELQNSRNRDEIVALFLAILHLIRDELIQAKQENHFDEIIVAKKTFSN